MTHSGIEFVFLLPNYFPCLISFSCIVYVTDYNLTCPKIEFFKESFTASHFTLQFFQLLNQNG